MSMSVTKGDGVTVVTVKSDPHSSCPLVCQLLGALCYSPVCAVSKQMRHLLGGAQSIQGTLHIMLGLLSIALGLVVIVPYYSSNLSWTGVPYWLGGTLFFCLLFSFDSSLQAFLSAFANIGSCAVAVAAIVLYSVDLATGQSLHYFCNWRKEDRSSYYWTTLSPEVVSAKVAQWQKNLDLCKNEKHLVMMLQAGAEILLIVLSTVQLCVAISASVLTIKALCRNCKGRKKDPEPLEPFLEEIANYPEA
ncbi:Membrane-spanning 4-domains subfamily A member 8A-like [Arapaima gigas]